MSRQPEEIGFQSLLKLLGADDAAEKYIALRERLERFFEWRGCEEIEELTDIVFDRLIKKINEGEKIENAEAYSVGIAKFVLMENRREVIKKQELDEHLTGPDQTGNSDDDDLEDERMECLNKCLSELPEKNRRLLINYFDTNERTMIRARKNLAKSKGLNLNALRIRISRLKTKLEQCTTDCCIKSRSL